MYVYLRPICSFTKTVSKFLYSLIPILLFCILLSIFVNSTDRRLSSGGQDTGNHIGVDFLAKDRKEAELWGCFVEMKARDTSDIHWEPGMTVLVNSCGSKNGVYMVVPDRRELSFVCLRPLVSGESYSIHRGTFAGFVYRVPEHSPLHELSPRVCPSDNISAVETLVTLTSSLETTAGAQLRLPFVQYTRTRRAVVDTGPGTVLDCREWSGQDGYGLDLWNPTPHQVVVETATGSVPVPPKQSLKLWFTSSAATALL